MAPENYFRNGIFRAHCLSLQKLFSIKQQWRLTRLFFERNVFSSLISDALQLYFYTSTVYLLNHVFNKKVQISFCLGFNLYKHLTALGTVYGARDECARAISHPHNVNLPRRLQHLNGITNSTLWYIFVAQDQCFLLLRCHWFIFSWRENVSERTQAWAVTLKIV